MKRSAGLVFGKLERLRRRLQAHQCERICSQQADPLADHPRTVVTIFFDVEGDYAMPGMTEASADSVRRILEIVSRYRIRSTFNMVGALAGELPALAREIVNGGHELASHSFDHRSLIRLPRTALEDDVRRTKECFENLGISVVGHRSPRSAWNRRVMRVLANHGFRWSAENGREGRPYRIQGNRTGELWRFPVTDDDWAYERDGLGPDEVSAGWRGRVENARRRRQYVALGFHPWVQAPRERLDALESFLHWTSEQADVEVLTFGQVLDVVREAQGRCALQ